MDALIALVLQEVFQRRSFARVIVHDAGVVEIVAKDPQRLIQSDLQVTVGAVADRITNGTLIVRIHDLKDAKPLRLAVTEEVVHQLRAVLVCFYLLEIIAH